MRKRSLNVAAFSFKRNPKAYIMFTHRQRIFISYHSTLFIDWFQAVCKTSSEVEKPGKLRMSRTRTLIEHFLIHLFNNGTYSDGIRGRGLFCVKQTTEWLMTLLITLDVFFTYKVIVEMSSSPYHTRKITSWRLYCTFRSIRFESM